LIVAASVVASAGLPPWKPTTWAADITLPRYGSSPLPSAIRPQRGSRETSTIGEKVQWMPNAAASTAAMRDACTTVALSNIAASPSPIGNTVRHPWITS
jgi:hypothetical protein